MMSFHSDPSSEIISMDAFIDILVHVLEHAVYALSASDIVTIAHLFDHYDSNGDGSMVRFPSRITVCNITKLVCLSLSLCPQTKTSRIWRSSKR